LGPALARRSRPGGNAVGALRWCDRAAVSQQAGARDRAVRRRRHAGLVGRIISQQLAAQTGQTFVVENRPGADGVVGAQTVAEAPPDGYTLLVTSSSFVVNPSFHKKLPFDVVRDFEPVSNVAAIEAYILGVNPNLPARSVSSRSLRPRSNMSPRSFGRPASSRSEGIASLDPTLPSSLDLAAE
jgi:hypothetical protein